MARKQALVEKLIERADKSRDPDEQYAALMQAYRLGLESGQVALVFEVLNALDTGWQVDLNALRTSALYELAESVSADVAWSYFDAAEAQLKASLQHEQLDAASDLIAHLEAPFNKLEEPVFVRRFIFLRDQVNTAKRFHEAKQALAQDPTDAAARWAAGTYLCFQSNRFAEGLAYLADSGDALLEACIQGELQPSDKAKDQMQLGLAWFTWADTKTGASRIGALRRVDHWYGRASSLSSGQQLAALENARRLVGVLIAQTQVRDFGLIGRRFARPSPTDGEVGKCVDNAVAWLVRHQSVDGSWQPQGFLDQCDHELACGGSGEAEHVVGVSALALLALMAQANESSCGDVNGAIERGVDWLILQQDPATGLIGQPSHSAFLYSHAIATQALCEAQRLDPREGVDAVCQSAVRLINMAHNYNGAWRYTVPGNGENDTSITGWVMAALGAAQSIGLEVDPDAMNGAMNWIEEMTDLETGRIGYDEAGGQSSRAFGKNDHNPKGSGEAMTAMGLKIQVASGQPFDKALRKRQLELLADCLPVSPSDSGVPKGGADLYYWLHATEAMFALRDLDKHGWKKWTVALEEALMESQAKDSGTKGSWEANCVWGYAGGRVYATALSALALSTEWRALPGLHVRE